MRETSMRTWILLGAATLLLGACTKKPAEPAPAPAVTAAEADAFIQGVNDDYRVKIPYFSAAQWAQQTYITDDTQLLSSRANDEFLEYVGRKLDEAKRFNGLELAPATARGMLLLKLSTANPAPKDAAERAELTRVLAKMDANYGAAKWCRGKDDCLSLGEIEKIIDDPAQTPNSGTISAAGAASGCTAAVGASMFCTGRLSTTSCDKAAASASLVITMMLMRRLIGLSGCALSSGTEAASPTTRAVLPFSMPPASKARRAALARSVESSQLL